VVPEETLNENSRLSENEQITLMTLWCIFRSPLMIGGSILDMDEFTINILTNKEVLEVNQESSNNRKSRPGIA
jgi:alpha-galactosidase